MVYEHHYEDKHMMSFVTTFIVLARGRRGAQTHDVFCNYSYCFGDVPLFCLKSIMTTRTGGGTEEGRRGGRGGKGGGLGGRGEGWKGRGGRGGRGRGGGGGGGGGEEEEEEQKVEGGGEMGR